MKIRLKFVKQGQIKFVGHLDMIRLFQRAIKIVKIPMTHSQGFNPHPLIYFAMPLSVGTSSIGEYMDIITAVDLGPHEVKDLLNGVLVEGIEIVDAFEVEDNMASLMSLVSAASYEITLPKLDFNNISIEFIKDKLEQETLITEKKGKKGVKSVDIKPMLLDYRLTETQSDVLIQIKMMAGSNENLSPQLFLKAILDEVNNENKYISITRQDLYADDNGIYRTLDTYRRK